MRANFGLCVRMHSPTDVHTLMGACTHEYRPPPNIGRERSKGVGMCTVSGGQWSWFLSFYLYVAFGTQTQVARLVWQTPFAY